jgi:hypothetical protein
MTQALGTRTTITICGSIAFSAAAITYAKFKDRGEAPESFLVDDVLEATYEDKKD